jgi:hypothetical protein
MFFTSDIIFTTCDLCKDKDECLKANAIINIRSATDYFDHYYPGIGKRCPKIPESKNN